MGVYGIEFISFWKSFLCSLFANASASPSCCARGV